MFEENNLPHELLLTARQKTKLRNAFDNNMSTDIKLSKTHLSKINQAEWFLGSLLSKIAGPLLKVALPFAKKYFSSIRNNCSWFSNWCRNSKENTWFWNNNSSSFKLRNEWYNENCLSSWRF